MIRAFARRLPVMSYANLNGLSLYFSEHGSGASLVLLHGGIGASETLAPIVPELAARRRVITVDLQAHGRTADIDRPLRPELLADDIAALAAHLGLEQIDVMGYSLGGAVALRTAIQHPALVRRLVLVSIACRRDGNHPEVVAAMGRLGPEAAEPMKQSPAYAHYAQVAPRPEDWPVLIGKVGELLKVDYDWTQETAAVAAPTMLVFADADSIRPAHMMELFGLFGGGLRDAGWDGAHRPAARLAILPGTTHYDLLASPLLAPAAIPFLDAADENLKAS
jgi:pimeloyl-ACP methyl ester carboxylesterase